MLDTSNCQEYYDQVLAWAKENNLWDNEEANSDLKSRLEWLGEYADHDKNGRTKCVLFEDWAPYSFSFTMYVRDSPEEEYRYWFNGGLILHGAGSSGVGAPEFSVRIGDASRAGWSVHT